jgi:hypothetical protein
MGDVHGEEPGAEAYGGPAPPGRREMSVSSAIDKTPLDSTRSNPRGRCRVRRPGVGGVAKAASYEPAEAPWQGGHRPHQVISASSMANPLLSTGSRQGATPMRQSTSSMTPHLRHTR